MPSPRVDLEQACRLLRLGKPVAIPTETVYGLAADARLSHAVASVYQLKGRPAFNPLISHVHSIEWASRIAQLDPRAIRLLETFSPGPLTLVLPARLGLADSVCDLARANLNTIAIRIPDHPIAIDLLRRFDGPLAAPSANRSNRISPTHPDHVDEEFNNVNNDIVPVLDGGPCKVGLESTVLDLTPAVARILRPGAITLEMLRAHINIDDAYPITPDQKSLKSPENPAIQTDVAPHAIGRSGPSFAPASPGQLPVHYAPRTPTLRFEFDQLARAIAHCNAHPKRRGLLWCHSSNAHAPLASSTEISKQLPSDPAQASRELYQSLRELDALRLDELIICMPESSDATHALRDRLSRAARPFN